MLDFNQSLAWLCAVMSVAFQFQGEIEAAWVTIILGYVFFGLSLVIEDPVHERLTRPNTH